MPQSSDEKDVRLLSLDLNGRPPWLNVDHPVPHCHISWVSRQLGISTSEIRFQLVSYGLTVGMNRLSGAPDDIGLRLMSHRLDGRPPWISRPVPPGHVVKAVAELGISMDEAVARFVALDLLDPKPWPRHTRAEDVRILSRDLDGILPWLDPIQPVTPYHLVGAHGIFSMSLSAIADRLGAYGLRVAPYNLDSPPSAQDAILLGTADLIAQRRPIRLYHLVRISQQLSIPIEQVAERLRDMGVDAPDPAEAIRAAIERIPR